MQNWVKSKLNLPKCTLQQNKEKDKGKFFGALAKSPFGFNPQGHIIFVIN